jgi:hypothetical protein
MGLSCTFGFHKWEGCKCTQCGKTRDQAHTWKFSQGLSVTSCKCSTCGKVRDEGHDFLNGKVMNGELTCRRCGTRATSKHNPTQVLMAAVTIGKHEIIGPLMALGADINAARKHLALGGRRLDGFTEFVIAQHLQDEDMASKAAAAPLSAKDADKSKADHPTETIPDSDKAEYYQETPLPTSPGKCSDSQCPCTDTKLLHGQGYLYISPDAVEFMRDCRTSVDLGAKMGRVAIARDMDVAIEMGTLRWKFQPILICEQAAKNRGLNLDVAANDARLWWGTGKVLRRATPLVVAMGTSTTK